MSFFEDYDGEGDDLFGFLSPGTDHNSYEDNSYNPFTNLFGGIRTENNAYDNIFNSYVTDNGYDSNNIILTNNNIENIFGEYESEDPPDILGGLDNDNANNNDYSYSLFDGFPTFEFSTEDDTKLFFPDSFRSPSRFSGSSFFVPISVNNGNDFDNSTNRTIIRYVRRTCGFPAFCNNSVTEVCSNTTILTECSECSVGLAALFATASIILGLLILVGNSLVIWSVLSDKVKTKRNKIKASLAFADIFTAINLLVVVVYNFSWSIVSTPIFIEKTQLSLPGSKQAIAGGIFYMLGFTASLYHLVFLGLQRFYAIMWPIKYKQQTTFWFSIGMVMVWIFSITTATSPLWFTGHATFSYFSAVFLYLPSPELFDFENQISITTSTVMTLAFTLLPYVLMSILTIATAFLIHFRFKKSKAVRSNSKATNKLEISAFKTVALMQFGFTITLAPLVIAQILFLLDFFRCDEIAIPFTVCAYLTMSNSLVNVLIYSARDKEFKEKVKYIFTSTKSKLDVNPNSPSNSKNVVPSKKSEQK